ncbi:MAG: AEC family transporter [Alphaproteobacteria bacterium]|nr:AEC family transporter [Alphaproteobacteria bacterium]
MLAIVYALAPLFVILLSGMGLRKTEFVAEGFWRNLEKLTFWALLPALFLKTMADADFSGMNLFAPVAAATTLLMLSMVILVIIRRFTPQIDGPAYSSVIQGATRFNNYVGLPVTLSLFGESGIVVYAIIISALIPLTNITSVWALSHYASHEKLRWAKLARQILTNPLIISTLLGIALSVTGIGLPPIIREVVVAFANASLLMGLLAIGASIDPSTVKTDGFRVMYSCFLKLVAYPALAIACGMVFGLDGLGMSVLILFAALPTATSSYILAAQMGGNAKLMANIVATETLLAFLTMPAWLWVAMRGF